jgi:hypothetical protein
MPKHWTEYTEDELLNFDGPQTAEIARYDRIMQKHGIDSMHGLKDRLAGLSETLTDVGTRLTDLGDNITLMHEGLTEKADEASKLYQRELQAQEKQQKAIRWLTIMIAASIVLYILITGASVWATIQSNHIQREMLEFQEHAATHST